MPQEARDNPIDSDVSIFFKRACHGQFDIVLVTLSLIPLPWKTFQDEDEDDDAEDIDADADTKSDSKHEDLHVMSPI